ncbi:MAG: sigma-54 dependent transcriptional regulator [Candidatus Contendobacter sp.]|nr:sigma-54 dependent transcriptional regulator [Candidatus Contendobacter sp.]
MPPTPPSTPRRILIVDDDQSLCWLLSSLAIRHGFQAQTAYTGHDALSLLGGGEPDVLLVDFNLPDTNGIDLLRQIRPLHPRLPVIIITAFAEIGRTVEAIKAGAYDYIAKPFNHDDLIQVIQGALAQRELAQRPNQISAPPQLPTDAQLRILMGPSHWVGDLIQAVEQVARSDFNVLAMGETGTGKELIAQAIHYYSRRAEGPFIPVDCGAIPETLFESELFGHEKGAFTGAVARQPGKFQQADGGTLFLDEIANMPLPCQAKLLRAIQEKTFYPVGSQRPVKVNVRLVAACNAELEMAAAHGEFRADLFFRLNEFTIRTPSLRQRREDILYLADRFRELTNAELEKQVQGFSDPALELLLRFDWPGNVRQLRNTVRQAVLLADTRINLEHLNIRHHQYEPAMADTLNHAAAGTSDPTVHLSLREIVHRQTVAIERDVLRRTLRETGGNKAKAARLLKIDYKTIHCKLKEYGIPAHGGCDPDVNHAK